MFPFVFLFFYFEIPLFRFWIVACCVLVVCSFCFSVWLITVFEWPSNKGCFETKKMRGSADEILMVVVVFFGRVDTGAEIRNVDTGAEIRNDKMSLTNHNNQKVN